MVSSPGDNFGVRWGNPVAAAPRHVRLLASLALCSVRTVVHTAVRAILWVIARLSNIDVSHAATFAIILDGFVLVGRLGELGNDVPRVQKTRDESQNAKENVDERIGAANTTLYPYYLRVNQSVRLRCCLVKNWANLRTWQWREDDGEHAKENVCGAHGG